MSLLSDIGIVGGCLFIFCIASFVILFGIAVSSDRRDGLSVRAWWHDVRSWPAQASPAGPDPGDDTLAMLCVRCNTGEGYCCCNGNCGSQRCLGAAASRA